MYDHLGKTLRACLATVPVQSYHELLPKYGVLVSCVSPFLDTVFGYILSIFICKHAYSHFHVKAGIFHMAL